MLYQIKNFFHNQIQEIVEDHETTRYRIKHGIDYLLNIGSILRISLSLYIYYFASPKLWQYDFLVNFIYLNGYQQYMNMGVICILFNGLMLLGMKTLFFSPVDTLTFQLYYDIIVRNRALYLKHLYSEATQRFALEKHQKLIVDWLTAKLPLVIRQIPNGLVDWLSMKAANLVALVKLDLVDRRKFYLDRLPQFPNISLKNRANLLLKLKVFDFASYILQLNIAFFIIIGTIIYAPLFIRFTRWWSLIEILIGVLSVFNQVMVLVQCGILMVYTGIFASMVYGTHLKELHFLLEKIRKQIGTQPTFKLNSFQHSLLNFTYQEHTSIAYKVIYSNRNLWGDALFSNLLVAIPSNSYMVCLLLLENRFNYFDRLAILTTITIHLILTAIPMIQMASVSGQLHATRKHIVSIQAGMGKEYLSSKLKYDDLFGRLTYGPRQGFTLGPMFSLSYNSLFELALTYVAVFLFILDKITSLQLLS